jgi:hypothetical protein
MEDSPCKMQSQRPGRLATQWGSGNRVNNHRTELAIALENHPKQWSTLK